MTLESRSTKNWLLWGIACGVYAFYIFGHAPVTDVLMYMSEKYTEEVYAHYVVMIGKVLLGLFVVLLAGVLFRAEGKGKRAAVWLIFIASICFGYDRMISYSIEYVHFIQYIIFTVVLFHAAGRNYVAAIVISLAAGLLDEWYQAGLAEPLNWRDYGLNTVGTVSGLLLIWTTQGVRWEGGKSPSGPAPANCSGDNQSVGRRHIIT